MNNKLKFDVNKVVDILTEENAQLTKENAMLKAAIIELQKENEKSEE